MSKKELTPQDYINYQVLTEMLECGMELTLTRGIVLSLSNATEISEDLQEYIEGSDYPEDYFTNELNCLRESGDECNIPPKEYSRHYEVDYVVKEIEGKWIGWNYWYGGGKYGEPDTIDWVSDSEFVEVASEDVVTVVKRTFKRKE